MTDERLFANTPASVPRARWFTTSVVGEVPRDVAEAIGVMVSELATNSLRHAETDFRVRVDRDDGLIRVAVSDSGPGQPFLRSPHPREPTGRGLRIVQALADEWGVAPLHDGRGKVVWFSVDLARRAEPARDPAQAADT
ncbi:MAG TPA: ATP-binding protein [Acidimicrobiia bacterium]|nr:ATP-binding protein [Acidimicrobiia bacterium]